MTFTALTDIKVGVVLAYRAGDPVPDSAVENLGLTGEQVRDNSPVEVEKPTEKPAKSAKKAEPVELDEAE